MKLKHNIYDTVPIHKHIIIVIIYKSITLCTTLCDSQMRKRKAVRAIIPEKLKLDGEKKFKGTLCRIIARRLYAERNFIHIIYILYKTYENRRY